MLRRTFAVASVSLALSAVGTDAAAVGQRTFVSTSGVDNPACSIPAPCRTFGAAITATASGGEVIALDSGGYGTVTITQSVSIIAPPGVYAGISVPAGDGVTVAANPASDKVLLRGLTVNGQGGSNGIRVTSGKVVQIEDCTIANMLAGGIMITGGGSVDMARLVVRGNSSSGVLVAPSAALVINVTLADSTLTGNGVVGFFVSLSSPSTSTVHAAITRVTASRNVATGIAAVGGPTGTVTMTVANSMAVENGSHGVFVSGTNATAIVSGSSLVGNGVDDLNQSGLAVLRTAGDNAVTGRGAADIGGVLTSNPLK